MYISWARLIFESSPVYSKKDTDREDPTEPEVEIYLILQMTFIDRTAFHDHPTYYKRRQKGLKLVLCIS